MTSGEIDDCTLCGNPGHDHSTCPHFGYATSAELFEALGASKPEAEKMERGLKAVVRRIQLKESNK